MVSATTDVGARVRVGEGDRVSVRGCVGSRVRVKGCVRIKVIVIANAKIRFSDSVR